MFLLGSRRRLIGLLLVSEAVLGLAAACGASDQKKVERGDAGAAGAEEGGGPASGGGHSSAGEPSPAEGGGGVSSSGAAGQATTAGAGPDGAAGANGGAGADGGAGAPPVDECAAEGSVTGLSLNTEPIYGGCRGAVLRVPFAASAAAAKFTCCGDSTSDPTFTLPLQGTFNGEDGGDFEFQVPGDAPYGNYVLELRCQTQPNDQVIVVNIGDSAAPLVLSVSAEVTPSSSMLLQGKHLNGVTRVGATRASDGTYYECLVEVNGQSDTAISCNFNGAIPLSQSATDLYFIDVEIDDCGHAADPPPFIVVAQPT